MRHDMPCRANVQVEERGLDLYYVTFSCGVIEVPDDAAERPGWLSARIRKSELSNIFHIATRVAL